MIQAASVLAAFKDQGYHVTANVTEMGVRLLKSDPHVDELLIQDSGQIPNEELDSYWKLVAGRFDRFVNLSQIVEVSLLATRNDESFHWAHSARHARFNQNYLEVHHQVAEVPFAPKARFYPTADEKQWARRFLRKRGGDYHILWSLSGSSVHKIWPYMDSVIAHLLLSYPGVRIYLVGDGLCQMLEVGWEKEHRVMQLSGKLSIRKTLTLAQHVDLVFGTETGVLNAVGQEPVAKVICLSHSSPENLTKHWVNTTALEPYTTPCYPCHKLIYGYKDCVRDPTHGVSLCAAQIPAHWVREAIEQHMRSAA